MSDNLPIPDADVEQILRTQGTRMDQAWVRVQLEKLYSARDPRLSQWDEIVREIQEPSS